MMQQFLIVVMLCILSSSCSYHTTPKITLDEYVNTTQNIYFSLSSNEKYLLIGTNRPLWESDRYEHSLWLHQIQNREKLLITNQLLISIKPKWSPSGNWTLYLIDKAVQSTKTQTDQSTKSASNDHQFIHLYNIVTKEKVLIDIGSKVPLALTWGNDDSSLYLASVEPSQKQTNNVSDVEWKDVIRQRQRKASDGCTIDHIDIKKKSGKTYVKITNVRDLDFSVSEFIYAPFKNQLIFTSLSAVLEHIEDFEIYSLDLYNTSVLSQLTHNDVMDSNLELSLDGRYLFFKSVPFSARGKKAILHQHRLYSIDLSNGNIESWGKGFQGSIRQYAVRPQGGVYILGPLGVNVRVYMQQSPSQSMVLQRGWNGTYSSISPALSMKSSAIVFGHSSLEKPPELYFINHINQLYTAKPITQDNQWFKQRNIPRAKVYRWINEEDDRTIEGILHYPPGKFECKNLPLLVLIHGGPISASLNSFQAPMTATEGWLVLQPNYRGSLGYGDSFVNEIRGQPLSRPGRDILAGVDRLVAEGIANPKKLAVGGYSYGGFLTNWLITQTTRFNAALSGAGPVEHVSSWGLMDIPAFIEGLIAGYPWEIPEVYYNESIMFKLGSVQTPTHIVTGERDVRVPMYESLTLERGLHYLNVPVQLLIFPNEGHSLDKNPWHSKIMIREELAWLEKYGHGHSNKTIQ